MGDTGKYNSVIHICIKLTKDWMAGCALSVAEIFLQSSVRLSRISTL